MVLSACYLPTHSLPHYHNIIDNLFLSVRLIEACVCVYFVLKKIKKGVQGLSGVCTWSQHWHLNTCPPYLISGHTGCGLCLCVCVCVCV